MLLIGSPVRMCIKSYCTTPWGGIGASVSKVLKFMRSTVLGDGQGADRQAILYVDISCILIDKKNVNHFYPQVPVSLNILSLRFS